MALLYVLLALGLNIVVGYAGLLDLGYVAFFAMGAYMFGLLASPHLTDNVPGDRRAVSQRHAHAAVGGHSAGALVWPGLFGVLLGAPTLKLARRLPGHRDAGLWRDHPRVHEQPGPPDQHHQRSQGHWPDRFACSSSASTSARSWTVGRCSWPR